MTAAGALYYTARPEKLPTEPFGQAGVRQYAGRVVAWVCLTISLAALAMAQRSRTFNDVFQWRGESDFIDIVSNDGKLLLGHGAFLNHKFRPNEAGWKYYGGYNHWRSQPGPQAAVGSAALGVEAGSGSPFARADSGMWVRVQWPLIAAAFMLQPVVWVVRRLVRRRAAA